MANAGEDSDTDPLIAAQEDVIILNVLDEENPFDTDTMRFLKDYCLAYFGIPLQVQQTPKTPVSPAGVLAMAEKTNRPLTQRNPRLPKEHKCKSTRMSQLFECIKTQKKQGGGIGPFPNCLGILAVTSGELYEDDTELLPKDPAPLDRVSKYGAYRSDLNIAVMSIAHLRPTQNFDHNCNLKRPLPNPAGDNRPLKNLQSNYTAERHIGRQYLRNVIKSTTYHIMKLLGYKGCQDQRCLLYRREFAPMRKDGTEERNAYRERLRGADRHDIYHEVDINAIEYHHHMMLCNTCETGFCQRQHDDFKEAVRFYRKEETEEQKNARLAGTAIEEDTESLGTRLKMFTHFSFCEFRYQALISVYKSMSKAVLPLQYKYRTHYEFERETDWLIYALQVFREKLVKRHEFLARDGKMKCKRMSLMQLLNIVHNLTPSIEVVHRTLAEPNLKIRCLTDMKLQAPYQVPVQLENAGYAEAVFNRRHTVGGVYHQMGGNLNGKSIGNFPGIGINAVIMKDYGKGIHH